LERENLIEQRTAQDAIRKIVEPILTDRGLELVELEVRHGHGGGVVRLFIDRSGGVRVADLESVSREVSTLLDVEDPIETRYTLEVSSPGLDRPLVSPQDFRRAQGQLVHVVTREPVEGRTECTARLVSCDEAGALELENPVSASAPPLRIPRSSIARARLEIVIPQTPRDGQERKRKKARKTHG
jgi:ribosome maturation factor RimP